MAMGSRHKPYNNSCGRTKQTVVVAHRDSNDEWVKQGLVSDVVCWLLMDFSFAPSCERLNKDTYHLKGHSGDNESAVN